MNQCTYKSLTNVLISIKYLNILFNDFFDIKISINIDNKIESYFEYKNDKYYFKYDYLEYSLLLKFISIFDKNIDKEKLYIFLNFLRKEFKNIIDDYHQIIYQQF